MTTSWRSLANALRDPVIDRLASECREMMAADAATCEMSRQDFEIQFRLHLPRLLGEAPPGDAGQPYAALRPTLIARCSSVASYLADAGLRANVSLLLGRDSTRRDGTLIRRDGTVIPTRFDVVSPGTGHFYQAKLHYMLSPRADTMAEFGCFLPGASHPITYLAFSACDRPHVIAALRRQGLPADRTNVLVLTRTLGLPGTAFNLMSYSLGQAARRIREMGCRFVVTAFNPALGFTGSTLQAANFVPFATAPVAYFYDGLGRYVTRRQSGSAKVASRATVNYHNLLAVQGVDGAARKELRQLKTMQNLVEPDQNSSRPSTKTISAELRDELPEYRQKLQRAWSERTVHPSYSQHPLSSKGQCGVSSVWLAQLLRMKEIEATYCFGRLSFDDPSIAPVDHHCWIEVGPAGDADRHVIDLTCDQADGFDQEIICEPFSELSGNGIRYEPQSRLTVDELPRDRVWLRFTRLEESMRELWGMRTLADCTVSTATP